MTALEHRWVLSGGIGSGKSAVRNLLDSYGFVTIDADSVGHEVLEPSGAAFEAVSSRWPEVVTDQHIDRQALGSIVFADPNQLEELEMITHPHIFGTILNSVKETAGPVIVEVPLLDHGLGDDWQRLIVDSADQVRLERLVDRGMTSDDARARMEAQPSRAEWLGVADLVIPNRGDLKELGKTVEAALSVT